MSSETSRFEVPKEQRKRNYKTWIPLYSVALGAYVSFSMKGFKHLRFRTNGTPRNPKEAIYKLNLLPLVRLVIDKAIKVDEYRKGKIEYWGITANVGKKNARIKVILRRIGKGKIHFWSVMKE